MDVTEGGVEFQGLLVRDKEWLVRSSAGLLYNKFNNEHSMTRET